MLEALDMFLEKEIKKLSKNSNLKKLRKIIETLIEENTWDVSIKAVVKKLLEAEYSNDSIRIILSYFHQYGDVDIVFMVAVKYYVFDNLTLKKLFKILNISDLEVILKKSIDLSYNNNYHILANNLISYYEKDLDCQRYLELIEYTKDYQSDTKVDNKSIIRFLTYKKSQLMYADVPDWVNVEEGENISLVMSLNPGNDFKDINSVADKLIDKAKDYFYLEDNDSSDKVNEALMSYLKTSSLEESQNINHKANRIFGPSNRSVDKNCISNPGKDGPCRMLECLCLEIDTEAPELVVLKEWFYGKCDNFDCSKRIRDRSHAVRIPMEDGGWQGCFCSFSCMDKALYFRDKNMNFRIESMKLALHEDGIMDRTKT